MALSSSFSSGRAEEMGEWRAASSPLFALAGVAGATEVLGAVIPGEVISGTELVGSVE